MDTSQALQTSVQIKSASRDHLVDHLGTTILASLLFSGIYFLVLNLITPSFDNSMFALFVQISTLVLQLLTGLFTSGFAYMYLQMIYKNKIKVSDLFHGFKDSPNKAILIQCFFVGAAFVCHIPVLAYEILQAESLKLYVLLILNILTPLLTFCVTIPISQSFFLLQDFPEQSTLSLLKASIRLMQGQKLRYFKLCLSFLPLLLVGVITLFLPILWLNSYYMTAKAVFYQELMQIRQSAGKEA